MVRRFVHGPGIDEPLVWYEGADTSTRRWYVQDELGSVIALTNASGAASYINSYDEYGRPAATNNVASRFQYTGQVWLEGGIYHYKARAYSPALGRFLQSDPILYAGGMNLYACVLNDPINLVDPWGLQTEEEPIEVWGARNVGADMVNNLLAAHGGGPATPGANTNPNTEVSRDEIVVTARRNPGKQELRATDNVCAHLQPGLGDDYFFGNVQNGVTVRAFLAPGPQLNPETTIPQRFGPVRQSTVGPTTSASRGLYSPGVSGRGQSGTRGGAIAPTMGVVNFEIFSAPATGRATRTIRGTVTTAPNFSTPIPVITGPANLTIRVRPSTFTSSGATVLLEVCPW